MPLLINLRQLERKDVLLQGGLSAEDLDLVNMDELIHFAQPLEYDLEATLLDDAILVQGSLFALLDCECGRCLKPFQRELDLPGWACHLPLEGEDAVAVDNDCVDLTPHVREDILLELPQRPLCQPDCPGLKPKARKTVDKEKTKPSVWAALNKLKL